MNYQREVQIVADRLWKASVTGEYCDPIREIIGEEDLTLAYEAQEINTKKKLEHGESIIGAKVGLTSIAVQKQLGVDQPDFGILTTSMQAREQDAIAWQELHQPKVEAEIAFVLKEGVGAEKMDMAGLVDAIECACASVEVVGSRIKDWNIRITDTIADNASASHFVLGEDRVPLTELDLEGCQMTMWRAGKIVSKGEGRACLGNPLNAALWLVNTLSDLGQSLKAGDVILAGALGPMVAVQPGDSFHAEIEGLGSVDVSFGQP